MLCRDIVNGSTQPHFMSYLVPQSYIHSLPGSLSQPYSVAAGIAALGTYASTYLNKRKMPRFRYGNNFKRRRLNPAPMRRWSRARARLTARRARVPGSRGTSGRGVTSEHPRQFIYRKKSMPRRMRKRWAKFSKKVKAVDEQGLGSRTAVFNNSVTMSTVLANKQILDGVALYPMKSTSAWMNDLANISALENVGANPTALAGQTVEGSTKMLFKSGVLDLTVRNTSNDGAGALLADATLEVDIYEVTVKNSYADTSGINYNTLKDYFTRGDQVTKDLKGVPGSSPLSLDDRGVTPWDLPYALSRNKIKIWKKTKFFINVGQTITYQIRDPKRRVTSVERLQTALTCTMNGWTKHVLFIAKFIPGFTISASVVPELTLGVTRKYLWKIEGIRDDRDYYNKV